MHKKVAEKRMQIKKEQSKKLHPTKYDKSMVAQNQKNVKEENELNREIKAGLKLGIIICAFLYAFSEMCAENIHWAIGDLILIALWIGGKSIIKELSMHFEADKLIKSMQSDGRKTEAA